MSERRRGEDSSAHWYDGHGMTSALAGMFSNPSRVLDPLFDMLVSLADPTSSPSATHSFVPSMSTPSPFAPMSHRHCTIDRHFRTMLSGAPALPTPSSHSSSDERERAQYVPPFVRHSRDERMHTAVHGMLEQGEREIFGLPPNPLLDPHSRTRSQYEEEEILRRHFGCSPRFPSLEAVQLLDADAPLMLPVPHSALSVEHAGLKMDETGRCGSTVCPCSTHDVRVEMNFWGAWAARCGMRGVKLLDREGKDVRAIWASSPSIGRSVNPFSGTMDAHSETASSTSSLSALAAASSPNLAFTPEYTNQLVEALDLDAELNQSIIRAALNRHAHTPSATFRSTALRPLRSTYAAASALLSVTLNSSKARGRGLGADDRVVLRSVVSWFAERGILHVICESFLFES